MSKDIKKLTFAEIAALALADRYQVFKENVVKPFTAINSAKNTATMSMHNAFKVVAMLKRDYAEMLHKKQIPPDTTEADFFKRYAGGDVPARVKQLATFFNAVNLTGEKPLITEVFLDAASVNSLEKAAAIIAEERKRSAEGWMGTDITLDVINALSTPGDATKKLKEIRARQKPAAADSDDSNTPASVLASLLHNRILEASDNDDGYKLFVACQELAEAWSKNTIPPERFAEWLARCEQETAVTFTNGSAPETAAANPAEVPAETAV